MRKISFVVTVIVVLFSLNFVTSVKAQPQAPRKLVDQAKKLANEGDRFFRQKNYRMAVDRYQKASDLLPNFSFPALYYNKGFAHYNLQQYDLALVALNKAFDQGYNQSEIYKVRWYLNYAAKDYDNALRDAEEAAKLEPNNANLFMAMGDIYREKNMDRQAVAAYEKAVLLVPTNGDLYYHIAYTYAKLGNVEQTGVNALKAVQNNTRFLGDSWLLVGNSFYVDRKLKEAADAFERAISAKPELTDAYTSLSQIYQSLNRFNEAIAITKKGIEQNPRDGGLYINLAWLLSLSDRHIEAIGAGKKAIEYAPDQYMGYTNLCRAYMDAKEYETALQICNNALKLKPDDGETYYYIGKTYSFQNKSEMATNAYKKAVTGLIEFTKERPDYSDGYYLLGNSYLALSQVPSAIVAYKKCLDLNPNFPKVIFNLGYSYVLNNDKKSARDQYNLLLKLDGDLAAKLLQQIQGN